MKQFIIKTLVITCFFIGIALITSSGVNSKVLSDDAVDQYSFNVRIDDTYIGSITSVAGLSVGISVYALEDESAPSGAIDPAYVEVGEIILSKRFVANSVFNDWIEQTLKGNVNLHRKTITITLIGHSSGKEDYQIVQRWKLHGCLPTLWTLSPLNTEGYGELTEHLTVACKRLEEVSNL